MCLTGRKFSADTAHAKPVSLIVGVARIHAAAIEVHIVRVVSIVLHGRPIESVRTGITAIERTVCVAVTDSGKLRSKET